MVRLGVTDRRRVQITQSVTDGERGDSAQNGQHSRSTINREVIMSVSVFWTPCPKDRKYLKGQSSLVEALERAFGPFPITLGQGDIKVLQGMSAVVCGHNYDDNPYSQLINAIEIHDSVTVSKE